jgi:hypothetical protein
VIETWYGLHLEMQQAVELEFLNGSVVLEERIHIESDERPARSSTGRNESATLVHDLM